MVVTGSSQTSVIVQRFYKNDIPCGGSVYYHRSTYFAPLFGFLTLSLRLLVGNFNLIMQILSYTEL